MNFKWVLLPSDIFFFTFVILLLVFIYWARGKEYYREAGRRIKQSKGALFCMVIIFLYGLIGFIDSIHYKPAVLDKYGKPRLDKENNIIYGEMRSLLDTDFAYVYGGIQIAKGKLVTNIENSYSAPLSKTRFDKWQNPETLK